ncbi:hypothetical protein Scep_025649 [Stephania cephalantha]|uniref:Uncharacterized protein n=1 Tax=Stephania cephalantha TaxID=152367 RepID=A0AAP0EIL1_9MAGN
MAFNGGLNSKIYAFRLLREQSIASSSFVEVTPPCPLLLCLVGDRSVRQRATASLLHVVHRAAAALDAAAAPPRRRHRSPPASFRWVARRPPIRRCPSPHAARHHPHARATSPIAGTAVRGLRVAREPPSALLVRRCKKPPPVSWSSAACTVRACWCRIHSSSSPEPCHRPRRIWPVSPLLATVSAVSRSLSHSLSAVSPSSPSLALFLTLSSLLSFSLFLSPISYLFLSDFFFLFKLLVLSRFMCPN